MIKHSFLSCLLVCVLGSSATAAPLFELSIESAPGANDFNSNVVGFISAYGGAGTAANLYSYGAPSPASYNGIFPTTEDRTNMFLVDSGGSGLTLFIVHDVTNDNDGGATTTRIDLVNDTAGILVNDDPGEPGSDLGGVQFDFNHNWVSCCTDGFVIGSLDGAFEAFFQYTSGPGGIGGVTTYSGLGGSFDLNPVTGQRIRIRPVAVPEPTSLALWSLFGAAAAIRFRRRKRAAK